MLFTIATLPTLSLLLSCLSTTTASPTNTLPKCAQQAGTSIFKTNLAYNISQINTVIGVFQNASWQNIPETSTTGSPNAIGSVRNLNFAGSTLAEKLTYSHVTPKLFEQKWYLSNAPVFVLAGALTIDYYYERLVVSPLCDGTGASKVEWTVDFCANSAAVAKTLFDTVHATGFARVNTELGGKVFVSC